MRFLLLIHGDTEAEAALSPDERRAIVGEHMAYADMLRDRGAYVHGEALDDVSSAAVVRPGRPPLVTDGPFSETKEAIGGFYVVDCASREEALELAAQVPQSPGAAVEVLKIVEF
jgi:hypothetical protein